MKYVWSEEKFLVDLSDFPENTLYIWLMSFWKTFNLLDSLSNKRLQSLKIALSNVEYTIEGEFVVW